MKPKSKEYLRDILKALRAIEEFVQGKTLEDYRGSELIRAAVERQFIIVGEALRRIERNEPDVAEQFTHKAEIIGFRNVLVHEYEKISEIDVWETIQNDVHPLEQRIEQLLSEPESES
jgi:uncharacterized protein with HEPN domain